MCRKYEDYVVFKNLFDAKRKREGMIDSYTSLFLLIIRLVVIIEDIFL
jgi:hypothetical protein